MKASGNLMVFVVPVVGGRKIIATIGKHGSKIAWQLRSLGILKTTVSTLAVSKTLSYGQKFLVQVALVKLITGKIHVLGSPGKLARLSVSAEILDLTTGRF